MFGKLAWAAWETVRDLMIAATGDETLRPGMVAVVQTAGDLARWHPHVHALVSRGGWTSDWEWLPAPYVDEGAAELLFRHTVIPFRQEEVLVTEERTELLLSWRHTGFSVHNRVRVEPEDGAAVERLARYVMRLPISLERREWDGVVEECWFTSRGVGNTHSVTQDVRQAAAGAFYSASNPLVEVMEPRFSDSIT